jgi:NTP pyrophosphatase (non-canonical NTP hydrolase)
MRTAHPKTLAQMTAEVVENNTARGWYENCVTFPEAMALLHSEVSEALEAWRKWGLDDATGLQTVFSGDDFKTEAVIKPEGAGSEFADIFIRLLDDCYLFGVDLEKAIQPGRFGINDSFAANINVLHDFISRASMEQDNGEKWRIPYRLADILTFLQQLCENYGINLEAEYERKMQYNRTRPHRHGNKRI